MHVAITDVNISEYKSEQMIFELKTSEVKISLETTP